MRSVLNSITSALHSEKTIVVKLVVAVEENKQFLYNASSMEHASDEWVRQTQPPRTQRKILEMRSHGADQARNIATILYNYKVIIITQHRIDQARRISVGNG